jgi:hypothetical protein
VPLDVAMCERCNPLGLKDPAASQVHGTVILVVTLAIIGLALLAGFALQGIGPFDGRIVAAVPDPPGISVTLAVTNTGTRAGSTTCRIWDRELGLGPETAFLQTPRIEPGATTTFHRRLTELGGEVTELAVECRDF